MILMIDNYDSFTYNLVQYFRGLGAEMDVVRNDKIDVDGIRALKPQALVLSPGPGNPDSAGVTLAAIKAFAGELPLFGICLGHQSIAQAFGARIAAYERETAERFADEGRAPLLYAVGDGNHSLAAAKTCWEALKKQGAGSDHPARFAMVELQNIRDPEQRFEPIHRIVTGVDPALLLRSCAAICAPGGHPVAWYAGKEHGLLTLDPALGELPVAVLQPFLDRFLLEHGGEIDYIHGEEVAVRLAEKPGSVAFLLPNISKGDFFRGIAIDGVLPRKTFSMGHAQEKRYYLECRRITDE